MEINGVDTTVLRKEIEAGYTPSSATLIDLITAVDQQSQRIGVLTKDEYVSRKAYQGEFSNSCALQETVVKLQAEIAAWRSLFPEFAYRPQDECVALK